MKLFRGTVSKSAWFNENCIHASTATLPLLHNYNTWQRTSDSDGLHDSPSESLAFFPILGYTPLVISV